MKPILVPTDFSEGSYNAAKYALELANATKAKIILLHIYQVPIPPQEMYISPVLISDLHEASMERLKKMADFELNINQDVTDLEIQYEAIAGMVVSEINEAAEKYKAGLIIMGTQGASGLIEKYILGSNTAKVIAKSSCPVLAVPERAKYLGLKRIGFAADFHEIKNNSSLDPLVEIALLFESEILIFFVRKNENEIPSMSQAVEGLNLNTVFEHITHSFHTAVSEEIVEEIDKFVGENHLDLLVTMPQKHSYFELIFNKSVTRNLVFHANTPILSLQGNQ